MTARQGPSRFSFDSPAVTARRLALALAASVALHIYLAGWIRVPEAPTAAEPIQATLIAAKEAPQAEAPKVEAKSARVAKLAPRPYKPPKPKPASATVPKEGSPEPQPAVQSAADDSAPKAASGTESGEELAQAGGSPAGAAPAVPNVVETPASPPLRAERSPLPQGTIRYDLFYGGNRFLIGRSELKWTIAEGRYQLATSGKTIGLAALFYPFGVTSGSGGRVTENGFQPDFFFVDRTSRKGEKQLRVLFDWDAGLARFSGAEGERVAPLQPASIDLLSLICQLSVLRLEPGPLHLSLTNGRKLDTYEVEVGTQEVVETPMGDLRAVYVKQLRKPGDEGIEVWLGVDFGYLPVRMRFTDRKGSIAGEQLVTDIRLVRG